MGLSVATHQRGASSSEDAPAEVAYARATVDERRDGECGEGRSEERGEISRPTDALVNDVSGRRDRERPNPRDRAGQRHKGREWPKRLRCGRWKTRTGASRSLGWPNAVHDRQLGARVARRHPRVGRSEVRESRIAKGSVNGAPLRRMLVIDAFSPSGASKRPASRYPSRPVTRSGQLSKKPPTAQPCRLYACTRRRVVHSQIPSDAPSASRVCLTRRGPRADARSAVVAHAGRRRRVGRPPPIPSKMRKHDRRDRRPVPSARWAGDEDAAPRPPRARRRPRDPLPPVQLTTTVTRSTLSSPTVLIGM